MYAAQFSIQLPSCFDWAPTGAYLSDEDGLKARRGARATRCSKIAGGRQSEFCLTLSVAGYDRVRESIIEEEAEPVPECVSGAGGDDLAVGHDETVEVGSEDCRQASPH